MNDQLVPLDTPPAREVVIEVRVAELRQLFNAMDPSPFRGRDLEPGAEEFIVGWAREVPPDVAIAMRVHVGREPGRPDEAALLADAVREFFANRARSVRASLRQLFRVARTSLVIGLIVLAVFLGLGDLVARWLKGSGFADVARESVSIGGWVAMWRPLELFLYDWWPIRAEARLLDRLAAMPVQVKYEGGGAPDAWQRDWPAAAPDARR